MSDQYRLVFSGEVLEGQHAAVVKKRLAAVLKLDDKRMDVLFSGKSVVVKNATDEANAARYQAAFQKAGARLRVLSAEDEQAPATTPSANKPSPSPATDEASAAPAADSDGLTVLPAGANVLRDEERREETSVVVETDHLKVQGAVFATDDPPEVVDAPNVDHITLAELGAMLGHGEDEEVVIEEIDVDFDLAEVGALLGALEAAEVPTLQAPDFELADPGADLDTRDKAPPPQAPTTDHIQLNDEENDETT